MSTNPTEQYDVYLGSWTNWSKGPVFGVTLTLTRRDANLLIAFVAFFVATVGTRFWRIVCLMMHYFHSSQDDQDALHHQRQVLLRNTANPETGMVQVVGLVWAWRHAARRPAVRLMPLATFSICCVSGFVIASGFSSSISTAMGNDVLLSSKNCRAVDRNVLFNLSTADEIGTYYFPYVAKQIANAANYAQQCYAANSSKLLGCGTFSVMRLPTIVDTNAGCPFDKSICKSQDGNLLLDTGLLDSHDHFGLNAPPHERVQLRRVVHCAPLVSEGYKSQFNLSSERSYTRYNYGQSRDATRLFNFTYGYSNDAVLDSARTTGWGPSPEYALGVRGAWYYQGKLSAQSSTFSPMPELRVPNADADIYLFFLSAGGIAFSSKVEDPWYKATHPGYNITYLLSGEAGVKNFTTYYQDEAASPLACTFQTQICNPSQPEGSRCSPLTTDNDVTESACNTVFGGTAEAYRRLYWIGNAAFGAVPFITDIVSSLGARALDSRYGLGTVGLQGTVPDNQWMLDVQFWNSISLASIQAAFIHTVTGPSDPNADRFWALKPNSTEERALCENQKIQSTAYVSFSVIGIVIIFTVGGLIILTSYALDPLLARLRKWCNFRPYQQLEWRTNDTLQLQRLAYEEIGVGTWSQATAPVPVTRLGDKIGTLDLSNPEHPMMRRMPNQVHGKKNNNSEQAIKVQIHNDGTVVSDDLDMQEENEILPRMTSDEVDSRSQNMPNTERVHVGASINEQDDPEVELEGDTPVDSGSSFGPPSPERRSGSGL